MLKNMRIQSLTNMDVTLMITTAKRKRKDHELHSSPSKLPDNQEKAKKENPLHPFSNCDYVACRFLAGTDPITRKELKKIEQTKGENGHERKTQEIKISVKISLINIVQRSYEDITS